MAANCYHITKDISDFAGKEHFGFSTKSYEYSSVLKYYPDTIVCEPCEYTEEFSVVPLHRDYSLNDYNPNDYQ